MKRCDECHDEAHLLRMGQAGYPYQRDYGPMWVCVPCQAWCGCHPGTENALGRLADAPLRKAKQAAHSAFDPLWQRKMVRDRMKQGPARRAGYKWLAEQMGLPKKQTHIGYFDIDQCLRVVEICTNLKTKEPTR